MDSGQRLRRSLRLQAGEIGPVAALTTHSFCVVGSFVVGRAARDAIFLERAGQYLPWMYLASALAVTLVGLFYGWIAGRFRRDRLAAATATLFALLTVGLWSSLAGGAASLSPVFALYVLVEVSGALAVLQLWTLANDAYGPRDARRIFPIVILGGIFANIGCGQATSWLAQRHGTDSLLLLCALLLLGAAALALAEGRLLPLDALPAARRVQEEGRERAALARDPHLWSIAALLVVTFLTTTVIDYQFKLSARGAFQGRALAEFFGSYYAITGFLALGVQLFATGRLLERMGLVAALAVLPLGLALGSLGFLVTGSLWAACAAQGSNVTFRYTINDSSVQLLYLPLPPRARALAKAWVEGIGKPAAIATAAAFLLLFQRLGGGLRALSVAALGLAGVWLALLLRARGSYVSTLEKTLRRRQLDLSCARLQEGDAAAVLRRALASANPREVTHALEILPNVPAIGLEASLVPLLSHAAAEIRRLAVAQVASLGLGHAARVRALFADPDPGVRAAAIAAFCALVRDTAIRSIRPFLSAPEIEVRSAAIAGLVRHGGLDGILLAGPALEGLLHAPAAEARAWGALTLGDIGVRGFYRPLVGLLRDPDLAVRRAALKAAARLKSPDLVPALVYRLGEAAIAADAAEALAAFGHPEPRPEMDGDLAPRPTGGIEPILETVLKNPREEIRIRLQIPRVLAKLASPEAARVLGAHLDIADEPLRAEIVSALARMRREDPRLPVEPARVRRAIDLEVAAARDRLASAQALGLPERPNPAARPGSREGAAALLCAALDEASRRALGRVLSLVGLVQPRIARQRLHGSLLPVRDGEAAAEARRAAALELLDNLLPRALRRQVVPFWEKGTRAETLARLSASGRGATSSGTETLARLATDPSPWIRACALDWIGHLGDAGHAPFAERALAAGSPRVREAALCALVRLSTPVAGPTLDSLRRDPDPAVQAAAEDAERTLRPPQEATA